MRNEIRSLSSQYGLQLESNLNQMLMVQLKGWLFDFYSSQGNLEAYNKINERTLEYKNKISKGISEEGYILRERIL